MPRSFRLTGNIVSIETQVALEHTDVRRLIEAFFEAQENWQIPTDLVVQTLETLSKDADVVFLTAMPPRYREHRRRLLDQIGLTFPMIASEEPKGPIMQRLHAGRPLPSVFIDDMAHNLHSVRDHVTECLLLHMMPESPLHLLAPKPDEGITRATDWTHAAEPDPWPYRAQSRLTLEFQPHQRPSVLAALHHVEAGCVEDRRRADAQRHRFRLLHMIDRTGINEPRSHLPGIIDGPGQQAVAQPLAPELRLQEKQLTAQTEGSFASTASSGRETVRGELNCGTSWRGPTCTQATGSSSE